MNNGWLICQSAAQKDIWQHLNKSLLICCWCIPCEISQKSNLCKSDRVRKNRLDLPGNINSPSNKTLHLECFNILRPFSILLCQYGCRYKPILTEQARLHIEFLQTAIRWQTKTVIHNVDRTCVYTPIGFKEKQAKLSS